MLYVSTIINWYIIMSHHRINGWHPSRTIPNDVVNRRAVPICKHYRVRITCRVRTTLRGLIMLPNPNIDNIGTIHSVQQQNSNTLSMNISVLHIQPSHPLPRAPMTLKTEHTLPNNPNRITTYDYQDQKSDRNTRQYVWVDCTREFPI